MSSFFSSDGSFSLQFAIIFAVIFVILAAGVFLVRRLTGKDTAVANKAQARGRQPRLGIVDIYELDRQRQLILLRRDNVEHLLLVGGPNDVVVERNITRGISARLANEDTSYDEPSEPDVSSQVPSQVSAQVSSQMSFADETPEPAPPRSDPAPAFPPNLGVSYPPAPAYREPTFAMPVVVPAPAPGGQGLPAAIARPLDLPPSSDAREEIPPPQSNTAPRVKESQLARVIRRAPPSLVNLVPASIKDRVRPPEPAPEPTPAPMPEPLPSAPVVSAPAARAIDAAILSDMARQLEDALRRPSAAVRPAAPVRPLPPEPEPAAAAPDHALAAPAEPAPAETESAPDSAPVPAADAPGVDPIAAAMSAPEPEPLSAPSEEDRAHEALFVDEVAPPAEAPHEDAEPARTEPVFVEPAPPQGAPVDEPAVQDAHREEPVVHAAVADAPVIETPEPPVVDAPPAAVAPEPPKPAAASKASASPNPFSVEEIEAEFARLLGRPLDRKS